MNGNSLEYLEIEMMNCTWEYIKEKNAWLPQSASWTTNIPIIVKIDDAIMLIRDALEIITKTPSRVVFDGIVSVTEDYGGDRYCFATVDLYPTNDETKFRLPLRAL